MQLIKLNIRAWFLYKIIALLVVTFVRIKLGFHLGSSCSISFQFVLFRFLIVWSFINKILILFWPDNRILSNSQTFLEPLGSRTISGNRKKFFIWYKIQFEWICLKFHTSLSSNVLHRLQPFFYFTNN